MIFADLEYMARTIAGEARGEPLEEKIAVGKSIVNRLRKFHRNETTIAGVCTEPYQYSCWNLKDGNRTVIEQMTFETLMRLRCIEAAVVALDDTFPDPTGGSTHYHTIDAPRGAATWPPTWAVGQKPAFKTIKHLFYNTVK